MKCSVHRLILVFVAVAILAAVVQAEAPRLINYQGRVLTAGGAPVPNGPHTFDFQIYDLPAAGSLLWSEPGVVIVTTNALFTYHLGTTSPFFSNMFTDFKELWLEVTVDGQLQTPRTRLVSNPYAETAGNISLESPFFPGQLSYKTDPSASSFSTYGIDGLEQIRLWGVSWGEVLLYDGDPTNDNTATLAANFSGGGELRLTDDFGGTTIRLHGGAPGDLSAILPTDAINSFEIMDEPGVASMLNAGFFFVPVPGDNKIDSVDITIPGRGFVEITAGAYLNMWHITGTTSEVWLGITKAPPLSFADPGTQVCSVPFSSATSLYQFPCTSTRMFMEAGPGTYRYYVNVNKFTGADPTLNVAGTYIRAIYYPTAYGSLVMKSNDDESSYEQARGIPSDGSQPIGDLNLKVHTLEEMNAKLAAESEALKAEVERLRKESVAQSEAKQRVSPK
jgi:hypothetical protein